MKTKELYNKQFLLTPEIINEAEDSYQAVTILSNVLKQSKAKNIAVSGPYGSGKSSVLETLKQIDKEHTYLNLSLATLKTELNEEEKNNSKTGKIDDKHIEYSILQQLIYREKASKTSQSRFKKIHRLSKWNFFLYSIAILLFFISFFFLFEPPIFHDKTLYHFADDNSDLKKILNIISFLYIFLWISFLLIKIILISKNCKIEKLNFRNGDIDLDTNISIFNKHLDEIIYFFQVTKYNIVIIEDLDRFSNPNIFLKMRELNLLLNESDQIKRFHKRNWTKLKKQAKPIVFIYAVKDNLFINIDRTKFFDHITTIIPIVNFSNSGNKLFQILKEKKIYDGLDEFICKDLGFYIDDMRILKNIVNEFVQYKDRLYSPINNKKLLGIIIYKNYYPNDFTNLHNRKGIVYKILNNKLKYIEEITKLLRKDIYELPFDKIKTKEEINNLKSLTLQEILSKYSFTIKSYSDNLEEIKDNRNLIPFLLQNGYIDENYCNYISYFHEGTLSPTDYFFISNLKIGKPVNYSYNLNNLPNIIKELPEIAFAKGIVLNFDLIDYLEKNNSGNVQIWNKIIECVIQTQAIIFLQEYYRRTSSPSNFIMKILQKWEDFIKIIITCKKEEDTDTRLEMFLKYFPLENPEVVNFKNTSEYLSTKLEWLNNLSFNKHKSLEKKEHNFIVSTNEKFPVIFPKKYSNQKSLILKKTFFSLFKRNKLIFEDKIYPPKITYKKNYSKYIFSNYRSTAHESYPSSFRHSYMEEYLKIETIGINNLKKITKFLDIHFLNLDIKAPHNELMDYIIKNNFYKITTNNLKAIIHHISPSKDNLFLEKSYSTIKSTIINKTFLLQNLGEFINAFPRESKNEDKSSILSIIKTPIDSTTKFNYLKKQNTIDEKIAIEILLLEEFSLTAKRFFIPKIITLDYYSTETSNLMAKIIIDTNCKHLSSNDLLNLIKRLTNQTKKLNILLKKISDTGYEYSFLINSLESVGGDYKRIAKYLETKKHSNIKVFLDNYYISNIKENIYTRNKITLKMNSLNKSLADLLIKHQLINDFKIKDNYLYI